MGPHFSRFRNSEENANEHTTETLENNAERPTASGIANQRGQNEAEAGSSLNSSSERNDAPRASVESDAERELRKLLQEQEKTRAEERKIQEAIKMKNAAREKLQASLVPEPPQNSAEPLSTILFRFPKAKSVARRFLQSSTLKDVMDYLFVVGYSADRYKVLLVPHQRDLAREDLTQSVGSIFNVQESVLVERRY